MIRAMRRALAAAITGITLAGCQTTGVDSWTPTTSGSPRPDTVAPTSDAGGTIPLVGVADVAFEVAKDPYAYNDIPPGVRPNKDTLEGGVWYAIDRMEEDYRGSGRLIRNEALQTYINEIVCRLAGPYCGNIRAIVLRDPTYNAGMYSNGLMTIHTGFLLRNRNEAQAAAVIGHEIGHYIRRHGVQRFSDARAKEDFLFGLQMVFAAAGAPVLSDIATLVALNAKYTFSRDHEREADLIGINLMAMNNYDTREASSVWRQLDREANPDRKDDEISTATPFSASHPSRGERFQTLKIVADKLQGPDKWGESHEDRYRTIIGPLKFQFLEDEIRLRNWKKSLELLDILLEGGHAASEIHYFRGEIFRQRNREADKDASDEDKRVADRDRAIEAYKKSIETGSPPAQAYRALGQIYQRSGDIADARTYLLKYLDAAPSATDVEMIRYILGTMPEPTS